MPLLVNTLIFTLFSCNKFTNWSNGFPIINFYSIIYGMIFVSFFKTNLKPNIDVLRSKCNKKDGNKSIWSISKIIRRFVQFDFHCNYKEGMERKREKKKTTYLISAEKTTFDDKLLCMLFFVATVQC